LNGFTNFEWIKLILDKWAVLLPATLFLASSVGWSFSSVDNSDKDIEIEASQEQIRNIANYYAKPKVVKSTCSPCGSYLNQHLKQEH